MTKAALSALQKLLVWIVPALGFYTVLQNRMVSATSGDSGFLPQDCVTLRRKG